MKSAPEIALEIIMFIALCTYLSEGEGFYTIHSYAEARKDRLQKTIGMKSVPSHDTFDRVFQAISPERFGECLIGSSQRSREKISGDVVGIDGKTNRRTKSDTSVALHTSNAWSVGDRLVLGQLAVEEKSDGMTAVPKSMDMLDLKGCIVTTDALDCQKTIAKKAIDQKSDHILAVKKNQKNLYDEAKEYMTAYALQDPAGFETIEKGHGRIEICRYRQSEDIDWYADKESWCGLHSFCVVGSIREIGDIRETSHRYHISSLSRDEANLAKGIRGH